MKKLRKKDIKKILGVVLGIGLIAGAIALISNLVNKEDDGFEKVHLSYEIGGLDENGKYEETKGSLYTKKAIELNSGDELQFTLDFENDIQYQLFFYDGNDEFVSSSEVLTKNHKYVAESDTSVRVLITPVWDEDVEEEKQVINVLTKSKYTKQLSVEVKRIEPVELPNEFVVDLASLDYSWITSGSSSILDSWKFKASTDNTNYALLDLRDFKDYTSVEIEYIDGFEDKSLKLGYAFISAEQPVADGVIGLLNQESNFYGLTGIDTNFDIVDGATYLYLYTDNIVSVKLYK